MTDEASKIVNQKQFVALVKAADQAKTKVASINGELGERIKTAVENGHLHAGAFKFICKLSRMDEAKRDEFLRQFDIYREMAIKAQLFGEEHVGDLADQAEKEAAKDAEADQAAKNAAAIEGGIGKLPDAEFDDSTSSKPSRRRSAAPAPTDEDEANGSYTYN